MIRRDASCLVLIDLQERLTPAIHEAGGVLRETWRLARAAARLGVPILATEQNPAGLGPLPADLRAQAAAVIAKTAFDASAEPDGLPRALPPGRPQVVLAGCEAHVCVLQTALGLKRAGHAPVVAADAVGSRRPEHRALALERLARAGVEIAAAEMILFEWVGDAADPAFRDVLALVKGD